MGESVSELMIEKTTRNSTQYCLTWVCLPFGHVVFLFVLCLLLLVLSCLVCNCCCLAVYIVVVVSCVCCYLMFI